MNFKKSKKEIPETQKDKLKNIFFGNSIEKNIAKNQLNPQNYALEKEEVKPIVIQNNIPKDKTISKSNNINEITNNKNIVNNFIQNITQNTLKKILENKKFNFKLNKLSTNTIQNNKNIDLGSTFIPSNSLREKMTKVFGIKETYNFKNMAISKNNLLQESSINNSNTIINQSNAIPALKEGGLVTEPMVTYLHKNEVVVPLEKIKELNSFIKSSNYESNTITKNESIKNVSSIRDTETNNTEMLVEKVKELIPAINAQQNVSQAAGPSFFINQNMSENPVEPKFGDIGSSYVGSTSKEDFFRRTYRIPDWRSRIG